MLVVKRPFRNYGIMLVSGQEVLPQNVKRFKGRIRDGFLVEVTEDTFDKWNEYFKTRFGTPIQLIKAEPAKEAKPVKTVVKGVVKTTYMP